MPSRTAHTLGYIAAFIVTEAVVLGGTLSLIIFGLFRRGLALYRGERVLTFNEIFVPAMTEILYSPGFWFFILPLTSAFSIYLMRQMHHRLYAGTGQLADIKSRSIHRL